MKKLHVLIAILMLCMNPLFAQVKKAVDNGLFVTFPNNPEYQNTTEEALYLVATTNCMFMALIQRNVIPNYPYYLSEKQHWTSQEILYVENSLLDGIVKGRLEFVTEYSKVQSIKLAQYNGRQYSYSAVNPATGEIGKRFLKFFLVRNKVISFEAILLNNSAAAQSEKNKFLNSISIQ